MTDDRRLREIERRSGVLPAQNTLYAGAKDGSVTISFTDGEDRWLLILRPNDPRQPKLEAAFRRLLTSISNAGDDIRALLAEVEMLRAVIHDLQVDSLAYRAGKADALNRTASGWLEPHPLDDQCIHESIALSVRASKALKCMGVATVRQLRRCTAKELLGQTNFGKTSLLEVMERLESVGLSLAGEGP